MAPLIYSLCLGTALGCAAILLRAFLRTRRPLLMWATLCFLALALNEALVIVDLYVIPDTSLILLRSGTGLLAAILMLIGLIVPIQGPTE